MQIMIFSVVLIAIVAFIIYKVNNKFETKEIVILVGLIIISIITTIILFTKSENRVPDIFKEKYQKEKNVSILKLSFERLNNKTLSSNTHYTYKFDYIINKDGKESVCIANNVKVNKIEDEYIFEDFKKLNEKCRLK